MHNPTDAAAHRLRQGLPKFKVDTPEERLNKSIATAIANSKPPLVDDEFNEERRLMQEIGFSKPSNPYLNYSNDHYVFKSKSSPLSKPVSHETNDHVVEPKAVVEDKDDLITILSRRVTQLETANRNLQSSLLSSTEETSLLKKELEALKNRISVATDSNTNASLTDSTAAINENKLFAEMEDEILRLHTEKQNLELDLREIHEFLNDYGLEYVGRRREVESSSSVQAEHTVTVDIELLIMKLRRLNAIANETTNRVVSVDNVRKFDHSTPHISVVISSTGILIKNGPERPWDSEAAQRFISDVLDGYFPSEFRDIYPHGVVFDIVDSRPSSSSKLSSAVVGGVSQPVGAETTTETRGSLTFSAFGGQGHSLLGDSVRNEGDLHVDIPSDGTDVTEGSKNHVYVNPRDKLRALYAKNDSKKAAVPTDSERITLDNPLSNQPVPAKAQALLDKLGKQVVTSRGDVVELRSDIRERILNIQNRTIPRSDSNPSSSSNMTTTTESAPLGSSNRSSSRSNKSPAHNASHSIYSNLSAVHAPPDLQKSLLSLQNISNPHDYMRAEANGSSSPSKSAISGPVALSQAYQSAAIGFARQRRSHDIFARTGAHADSAGTSKSSFVVVETPVMKDIQRNVAHALKGVLAMKGEEKGTTSLESPSPPNSTSQSSMNEPVAPASKRLSTMEAELIAESLGFVIGDHDTALADQVLVALSKASRLPYDVSTVQVFLPGPPPFAPPTADVDTLQKTLMLKLRSDDSVGDLHAQISLFLLQHGVRTGPPTAADPFSSKFTLRIPQNPDRTFDDVGETLKEAGFYPMGSVELCW